MMSMNSAETLPGQGISARIALLNARSGAQHVSLHGIWRCRVLGKYSSTLQGDGKTSGAGRPQQNEIRSGRCVIFRSSRMLEPFIRSVRNAYRTFQTVEMSTFLPGFSAPALLPAPPVAPPGVAEHRHRFPRHRRPRWRLRPQCLPPGHSGVQRAPDGSFPSGSERRQQFRR